MEPRASTSKSSPLRLVGFERNPVRGELSHRRWGRVRAVRYGHKADCRRRPQRKRVCREILAECAARPQTGHSPAPEARPEAKLAVNFREVVHSVRTGNADVAKPQRFAEDRMDTHKNARLTPKGREEMVRAVVDHGMSKAAAARQFNTTPKTVGKWAGRFCAEGVDGLRDRSSRPLSSPS